MSTARSRLLRSVVPAIFLTFGVSASVAASAVESVPEPALKTPRERLMQQFVRHHRSLLPSGANNSRFETARVPTVGLAQNFKVLDHVFTGGPAGDADIDLYNHRRGIGKYAYVGTWFGPCTRGVKIIDVNRPTRAELVAVARLKGEGFTYEDVDVQRIGDRDVLAAGLQDCRYSGRGGLALFDVSRPRHPSLLSFLKVPSFVGVHELDLVKRQGGRVFALLTAPFSRTGDFRVVGVTYPKHPTPLSDWDIVQDSSLQLIRGGIGYTPGYFAHSARAADGGMTAYVSYWDAGVLKLSIANPSHPRLLARTTYSLRDEGNAHSLTPYDVGGRLYVLQNDEDEEVLTPLIVTSSATGTQRYQGVEIKEVPTSLSQVGAVSSEMRDAQDGCDPEDYAGAAGKVALVDLQDPFFTRTLPCSPGRQIVLAARANASALMFNWRPNYRPDPYFLPFILDQNPREFQRVQNEAKGMPVIAVWGREGLAAAIRAESSSSTVTLNPGTPSFGYLRVFRESTRDVDGDGIKDFEQVGAFRDLPHVRGDLSPPNGSWSIHNTEVNGDRAYSSWYTHGIVALDISQPRSPAKVGQFVPPTDDERSTVLGRGPALVWGVAVDAETGIIYVSDSRSGLWIVRPIGPAAASP